MKIDQLKNITLVGAGDMGHGIAEVALLCGYPVTLYDINDAAVEKGATRIHESVEMMANKEKIPADMPGQIRTKLLKTTTDLGEAAAAADLVIEAAPEVLELKKDIFAKLDEAAPPTALLASNTSTMSITDIALATKRPENVFGIHFFNPAVIMRLVEVIQTEQSAPEVIDLGMAFAKKLGKIPVHVRKDSPGFIANRVNQAPMILYGELIQRGEFEPEPLDMYMRTQGLPMGPCELFDYIGMDIMVNMSRYFAETLHPDYGPPPHMEAMLERGDLGKKTGKGYYDWSAGRPKLDLNKATSDFDGQLPIAAQINEATKLVEQGVCSFEDVDTALINSTGNPTGPMSLARDMEPEDLTAKLEGLASKYGKSVFVPTETVRSGGYR